jgi:hypothetical protein
MRRSATRSPRRGDQARARTHGEDDAEMSDDPPPGFGRHDFRPATSFSIAMSSPRTSFLAARVSPADLFEYRAMSHRCLAGFGAPIARIFHTAVRLHPAKPCRRPTCRSNGCQLAFCPPHRTVEKPCRPCAEKRRGWRWHRGPSLVLPFRNRSLAEAGPDCRREAELESGGIANRC